MSDLKRVNSVNAPKSKNSNCTMKVRKTALCSCQVDLLESCLNEINKSLVKSGKYCSLYQNHGIFLGVREKFIFSEEFILAKLLNTRHKSEDCYNKNCFKCLQLTIKKIA